MPALTGAAVVPLDEISTERGVGLDASVIPAHEWPRNCAEAHRRIEADLAAGRSGIFDHANVSRTERDQVRALALRMAAAARLV